MMAHSVACLSHKRKDPHSPQERLFWRYMFIASQMRKQMLWKADNLTGFEARPPNVTNVTFDKAGWEEGRMYLDSSFWVKVSFSRIVAWRGRWTWAQLFLVGKERTLDRVPCSHEDLYSGITVVHDTGRWRQAWVRQLRHQWGPEELG